MNVYLVFNTLHLHYIYIAGTYIDCYDAMKQGVYENGVYAIQPINANHAFYVYCDMETDRGGWTVLLKRQDGSMDFYLNWIDYKNGFGNLEGEYWLGLDNMYLLTNLSGVTAQLRVDLADWEGNTAFAKYDQFSVGDEDSDYILSVSGYQSASTAGDSLAFQNGQRFSTPDRDNDAGIGHCALNFHGPWWHNDCYTSFLTAKYYNGEGPWNTVPHGEGPRIQGSYGITWYDWKGWYYSLRLAEMKIRPAVL